jgi:hypothetical protein
MEEAQLAAVEAVEAARGEEVGVVSKVIDKNLRKSCDHFY